MKKITFISILLFVFLALSGTCTWLLSSYHPSTPWIPLVIGLSVMCCTAIVYSFSGSFTILHCLVFIFNSLAFGLCIRAWYAYRGFQNSLYILLIIALLATAVLWIYYLLLFVPFIEKHFKTYTGVFVLSVAAIYLLVMIFTKTQFVSTVGYYMIIVVAFIFTLCKDTTHFRTVFKEIAFATFSILVVVLLIAILMMEGDDIGIAEAGSSAVTSDSPKDRKMSRRKNPRP